MPMTMTFILLFTIYIYNYYRY